MTKGDNECYLVGVDVGTGSVRAALARSNGEVVRVASHPISTWNPEPEFFQQSSDDIWQSCCVVVKEVTKDVNKKYIKGLGFDATCSLVALDKNGNPLTVSPTGETNQNVILWMDHRAHKEAQLINETKHSVLHSVGGKISLEMEIPKLLWIKKNLHDTWVNAGAFFDLPDFLTWRCTGSNSRSLCSVVCKWNYEANEKGNKGWNSEFFSMVGIEDLLENNAHKIGEEILPPGSPCGNGLTNEAAQQLDLLPGIPVGTSIIDAHAGGLGLVGCTAPGLQTDFETRLGLICGTSTCHMAVSHQPVFVPGIWGPYWSAMVPGMWLNEGGQSATGKLIDHVIESHCAYQGMKEKLPSNIHVVTYLNKLLDEMSQQRKLPFMDMLTRDLHIWPDYHGNRSPVADPTLQGMVSGLTLASGEEDLALKYLATIQALAYGTRHILASLEAAGHSKISCILICGGLSKNPVFVQTHANVVGYPVLVPREPESVLVGASILAAYAAQLYPTIDAAVKGMAGQADLVSPAESTEVFHHKKYNVFMKMLEDQQVYKKIMCQ